MRKATTPAKLPLSELRNFGYLAEVNRQFFHPLGLALTIHIHDDGTEDLYVQDDRGDLEGWYMAAPMDDLIEKRDRVAAERQRRDPIRLAALGYVIQPLAMVWRRR